MIDEERDIVPPVPKGREVDGDHAQPVVEVLPERAARDHPLQALVGGRDHADIHPDIPRRADGLHLPLLKDPQEARLDRGARGADLVKEDRAAVGRLEEAVLAGDRPGEGAFLVPEELGLQQRLGDRPAAHRHERLAAAAAVRVEGASDELLSRAALAVD